MTLLLPWLIVSVATRVGVAVLQETCHGNNCVDTVSRGLLQQRQMVSEQATSVSESALDLALGELTDAARQLKQEELDFFNKLSQQAHSEVEQLKEGLQTEHAEVLTLRRMLSESDGKNVDSGMPVRAPTKMDEGFELCRAATDTLGQVEAHVNQSLYEGTSCGTTTEVVLFSPQDSSPYFQTQCCSISKEHCAGCAIQNSAKTSCQTCHGGFTRTSSGKCLACVDLPSWENKDGRNCHSASCSSEKFQGFSANEACCKCGGGQKAATSFTYYVGPVAIGTTSVVGHPVPRTASHYSVDKDCELAKHGLSIDPTTGALGLSCSSVGCGAARAIELQCTVTAEQEDGLSATALLEVMAGDIGYGSMPVVLRGSGKSSAPALNPTGSSGSFSLSCAPSASSWLNIDSSGRLSLKSGQSTGAGGVTGSEGNKLGEGGVCSVHKGTAKGAAVVVAPETWTSLSYSYGGSKLLYVTVGEKSPILSPAAGTGLKPTRFSADCTGSDFSFDVLTGIATWEGHQIFSLNTASGDLQLNPEESLTKTLDSFDASSTTRRKISTSCTIFGHYEWSPTGQGPVLTHRLSMEFRDHTCWAERKLSFAHRATKAGNPNCRAQCRSESYCTHYRLEGSNCQFYSGVCADSSNFVCVYKDVGVVERYPGCGERNGCLHLELKGHHYLSGRYCPGGENSASSGQGPVYLKKGLVKQESFWLMRYDASKGGCSSGDWAIYKADPQEDYENSSMAYVELHGDAVACVKGPTGDLVTDVFTLTKVDLKVSRISTSSARATVSAPGCVTPNVTAVDGAEEQPVEVLVLDDPSTDTADDHWLHPCDCVPSAWGSLSPVSGESVSDIPAGSNNEFMAPPVMIVDGQFVCEQEYLTEVIVESETDGLDAANCKTRCMSQECPYYWEGEVMSTKQCRFYSQCTELVREVGVVGSLYGMSYRKACKVADPQLCWKVTKRRSFLGAGDDSYRCFHQDLIQQCDQKLMLGGLGVSSCGGCEYAPVKGKQLLASNGGCTTVGGSSHNVYVAPCNNGDNQKWYFDGEALKSESKNDKWCLEKQSNGNLYLSSNCRGNSNQKWYFVGSFLKSRDGNGCVDSLHAGTKNMYVGNCPWSDRLQWSWRQTVHDGQQIATDYGGKCIIHDTNNNVYIGDCSVDYPHRWYWDGERLKSESTISKCLDVASNNNIYMASCHAGNTQKWYFDGKLLKSRDNDGCVDFDPHGGNNLIRGNCPDSSYKKWAWGPEVAKPMPAAQITCMQNNKCLDDDGSNLYMHPCHSEDNQKFYFDGKLLKIKSNNKCVDEPADGSLYMHACHGFSNQKFYWDNHLLKNEKWKNAKCMDKAGDSQEDIYMGSCHGGSNQQFNFKVARRFKTRLYPSKCLEWTSSNDNVGLADCDSNNGKQLFFFDGPQLKSQENTGKCLHRESSKNLKMADCQDSDSQKFVWDSERVKVQSVNTECIDAHSNGNVYTYTCHTFNQQKWYFDQPVHNGKALRMGDKCLTIRSSDGQALWSTCTNATDQRFYFSGEALKVESTSGCLDSEKNAVKLQSNCNGQTSQRWYWSGEYLMSKKHYNCLNVWPNNNSAFMGSCPNNNTQKFAFKSQLHDGVQLTVGDGRCLSRQNGGTNVEAVGCLADARQMWYLSGENLKTELDGKCLNLNGESGNVQMGNCQKRSDNKFYFDGKSLRDRLWGRCLEYQVNTGNVFSGTCPDQKSHMWKLDSQVALRKTPLPAAFQHGQSLEAKCWSERFTAGTLKDVSMTMSCVAGTWIISGNAPGLEGFTCTACLQVVSKAYADLDAKIRQELFFASSMKLTLSVDTRTRRTVTSEGSLRVGGTSDVFVAELMPDAADTMRRYRSLSEPDILAFSA